MKEYITYVYDKKLSDRKESSAMAAGVYVR